MKEIFVDIPYYEGLYQVSNYGRVKSCERFHGRGYKRKKGEVIRKLQKDKYGYLFVNLSKNGKNKTFKCHRLVLLAFQGVSNLEVNHKNGIKDDNRLDNLEYCTTKYNLQHSYDKKIRTPAYKKVKCLETGIVYDGLKIAAAEMGVHPSGVFHQLKGDQPKVAGLTFIYSDSESDDFKNKGVKQ